MAKGKTKSKLTLSERREEAAQLVARGFTDTDIARKLGVSRKTARSYREFYERKLKAEVAERPDLLRDVLGNTVRQLREFDDIRKLAWENLRRRKKTFSVICEECSHEMEYVYQEPPTDTAIVQYQNVLLKAADARAKLFGLLGVKQEIFVEIQNVNLVQNKILAWMADNLDGDARAKLADFIETDLAPYIAPAVEDRATPVLDQSSVSAILGGSEPIPVEAAAV